MSDSTISVFRKTLASYRKMIDETVVQLTDDEFFGRPSPSTNSVAVILRHLGGNLISRWTDFLTTDGEKESRDRDLEFTDWDGSRESLMQYFDSGWTAFASALDEIDETNIQTEILIRGEVHTLMQAVIRSITHLTYHIGQITFVSRLVHQGEWKWLTIAPDKSRQFNDETWGTSRSRAVFDTEDQ